MTRFGALFVASITLWALVFGFLLLPPAHAGFFSFLGKVLGEEEEPVSYNTQTMPLLKAPTTPDVGGTGGAAMTVVEDSALLPVMGPLGSMADADTYKLDQIATYTVREGDTLSKIANMFEVSVSTIYWANDLKRGDLVKPGDVLVILPISGIQHTVKKGDTIKSLAKKYKSDAEEIIAYNSLSANGSLEEGSTIIIPDAEIAIPTVVKGNPLRGGGGPEIAGYYGRPIIGGRKTQGLHGYNGVDLGDRCGAPIYASAAGTVIVARSQGYNGGYGKYVVVAHPNGTQTVYAHLASVFTSVGQSIVQGSNLGLMGNTGKSTGCHLHFEVRGAKNPF